MNNENKNNFSEQSERSGLEDDLHEMEETYVRVCKFRKGQSLKKKFKQNFNTRINFLKNKQRVSNMKDLADTDKTTSENTSATASSNNSHPFDGMAQLSFEDIGIVFWESGKRIKEFKK